MAGSSEPHFIVETLIEVGGGHLVLVRRLDDRDFVVRDGSLLGGVPISAADMPRHLNAVGVGRGDRWAFWLDSHVALASFAAGQVVTLQQPPASVEHE